MTFKLENKEIKIFTDGANLDSISRLALDPMIDGITTNPTLMRSSGVTNYMTFAKAAIRASEGKSLSLEIFSDEYKEMLDQALILSNLSKSVYVKVPITNSIGNSSSKVINELSKKSINLNITAVLTKNQIDVCYDALSHDSKAYISIFAGRIADTGRDPIPFIQYATNKFKDYKNVEILWASTREVFNVYQAAKCGCHIITVTPEIIKKIKLKDYDLSKLSLETVQMFKKDSEASNYKIYS